MLLAALAPINALAGAATPPHTRVDSAQLDQAMARHMQPRRIVCIDPIAQAPIAVLAADGKMTNKEVLGAVERYKIDGRR